MTGTLIVGRSWQDVLGHRLELSEIPTAATGGPGIWNTSLWNSGLWAAGYAPAFHDWTDHLLDAHGSTVAHGLETSSGTGTLELELIDLAGELTPDGSTDWLLGRHVRLWVTPAGRPERCWFYGIVDKAAAGGTFMLPTVEITAYDTLSVVAAAETATPLADAPQTAAVRLNAILVAAGIPTELSAVEADTTTLLADDTLELGDLFGRTLESAAGIGWSAGDGRIVTRNQDWVHGVSDTVAAYLYAGDPRSTPDDGVPVAQTSGDLNASQALSTVRNIVTYENRADPPVSATSLDTDSINRYGQRRYKVSDLACSLALLEALADRGLALWKDPPLVVDNAQITVYDEGTAAAATLELGDVVVVGRNDPGVAEWELVGIVAGREISLSPEAAELAFTVTTAAGLGGSDAVWNTATWDANRWAGAGRSALDLERFAA